MKKYFIINCKPVDYDIGKFLFNTDYDRENPVTKSHAIKEWKKILEEKERKKNIKTESDMHIHNFSGEHTKHQ